ncbi:hypothetical protein HG530_000748 [Fusarium avenaceum]|nr:hypothetical protein HG530_000748 [Fusarium avenaceum]
MSPSPLLSLLLSFSHTPPKSLLLFVAESTRSFAVAASLSFESFLPKLAAQLVRKTEHTAANRSTITTVLAFATRLRNLLGKIPKFAFRKENTCLWISRSSPGGVELSTRLSKTFNYSYEIFAKYVKAAVNDLGKRSLVVGIKSAWDARKL